MSTIVSSTIRWSEDRWVRWGTVAILAIGTIGVGCQRDPSRHDRKRDSTRATTAWRGISCDKSSEVRRRPGRTVLQGRVLLPVVDPPGASSTHSGDREGNTRREARDAIAPVDRRERPARGVRVEVYARTTPETVRVSTTTDSSGQWCISVPDDTAWGMDWMARAETSRGTLRRPLVTPMRQVISVRSEALIRLLAARSSIRDDISRAAYLNLQAIASTAVDLLEPVSWTSGESIDRIADRMQSVLERDTRVQTWLEHRTASSSSGDVSSDVGR